MCYITTTQLRGRQDFVSGRLGAAKIVQVEIAQHADEINAHRLSRVVVEPDAELLDFPWRRLTRHRARRRTG